MTGEHGVKKQISERRRLQNRQAQKVYRERQKRHLQNLQVIVNSTNLLEVPIVHSQIYGAGLHSSTTSSRPDATFHEPLPLSAHSASSGFDNIDGFSSPSGFMDTENFDIGNQFQLLPQNMIPPAALLNAVPASFNLPSGDQKSGNRSGAPLFNEIPLGANGGLCNAPQDLHVWDVIDQLVQEESNLSEALKKQILDKDITLNDILRSGIKHLASENSLPSTMATASLDRIEPDPENSALRTDKVLQLRNRSNYSKGSFPDIHKNNIRIKQVLFIAALAANAELLGISIDVIANKEAESPFFKASISEAVARASCPKEFSNMKTHLQPCASQIIYRHHPYIDALPFPIFRERVIKLTCTETPMIDENELCHDLQNDGLICWGSSLGEQNDATGCGSPWDIRSWEAQPWFLRKWWILLGGADGEIYRQTQWWCEMRGDRSLYPW